jgi:hypothetical protein
MKTIYRLFSTNLFLFIIAIIFLCTTVAIVAWGVSMFAKQKFGSSTLEDLVYGIALAGSFALTIWVLTSSVLPIVKIDSNGISAYSIFWKKTIKWKDLRTAKLVEVKNTAHRNGTTVQFTDVKEPEKKGTTPFKTGTNVNKFIVLSVHNWQKPTNTFLMRGLYTHRTIAGNNAIAFQYDAPSWKVIKEKRNQ